MQKLSLNLKVPAGKVPGFTWAKPILSNALSNLFAERRILAVLIALLLSSQLVSAQKADTSMSQQKADTSISHPSNSMYDHYMQKRKTFNTVGWVLLGSGAAMIIIGVAITTPSDVILSPYSTSTGLVLVGLGGVMALTSIPFFVIGRINAHKARLQLKSGTIPGAYKFNYVGVALKINL